MKSFKQLLEELQVSERYDKDLDANKNGKLDSDDFKLLRKKKKETCCNENEEYSLGEELELELSEISVGLASKVFNKRARQKADAWYKSYDEKNPEYQKAAEKGEKSFHMYKNRLDKAEKVRSQKQKERMDNMSPEDKAELERKAMYGGDTNNPRGLGS